MKTLASIVPTPEQLPIIQNMKPGVALIRGAAGSGKTSTAILRLKQLTGSWLSRRARMGLSDSIRVLVITFNRTLRGYIGDLARQQVAGKDGLDLTVSTFTKWAQSLMPDLRTLDDEVRREQLGDLCRRLPFSTDFLIGEVDYLLGRFSPGELSDYLTCGRDGRGATPRIERLMRERILNDVVRPYVDWKHGLERFDWNDLATALVRSPPTTSYDIIIADESQDLSANEVRAIMHYAADPSSVTFVLDAAQRIYPRGFTWKEAGIDIRRGDSYRLGTNYRNTVEICRFAAPLLEGMEIGDDGTLPDFTSCSRHGPLPLVLRGKYAEQANYAVEYIGEKVNLADETVAFLKPKGGRWFRTIKACLDHSCIRYVELTRVSDWPQGAENVGLCTMSSAKGLEFDHVIILGLNDPLILAPRERHRQGTGVELS